MPKLKFAFRIEKLITLPNCKVFVTQLTDVTNLHIYFYRNGTFLQ